MHATPTAADTTAVLPGPHAHPGPSTYVKIFALLAVFTAIEVVVASMPLVPLVKIIILVTLAVAKAALVVLYYMHLRYDSFWYWIILLVPVSFVVLLTRYLFVR